MYANPRGAPRKAKAWGIGVNWHFTRAVKVSMNYERTSFPVARPRVTVSRRMR